MLLIVRLLIFSFLLVSASLRASVDLHAIAAVQGLSVLILSLSREAGGGARGSLTPLILDLGVAGTFTYHLLFSPVGIESQMTVALAVVLVAAAVGSPLGGALAATTAIAIVGGVAGQLAGQVQLPRHPVPAALALVAVSAAIGSLSRRARRERMAQRSARAALRARERLSLLFKLAQKLTTTHELDSLQRDVLDISLSAVGADSGALAFYDPRRGDLVVVGGRGLPPESMGARISLGEGLLGSTAESESPILLDRTPEDSSEQVGEALRRDAQSAMCAPLAVGERLVGVLAVGRAAGRFSQEDLELFGALANQAAVAIDNAKLYGRLHAANLDLSRANDRLQGALRELQEAQDALVQREKMASVGLLAAGVAHEFNNLIGGMYSLADYACSHREDVEIVDRALSIVLQNSRRAREITEGLLSFSRRRDDVRELASLAEIVENVLQLVAKELENSSIAVVREHEPGLPAIVVSSGRIQQVVLNLVINSLHAIGRNGTLTVRTRGQADWALIEVEDDGQGIDPADVGKIFEPFFTTKGALGGSRTPGTGLGLSVTYNLVRDHGGEIDVASQPGKGTCVTVRLPRLVDAPVPRPAPDRGAGADEGSVPPRPDHRLTLLVVEDDRGMHELYRSIFRDDDLVVVPDADSALAELSDPERVFDYVFLDLVMPGSTDGLGVLDEIIASERETRVVITSGRAFDAELDRAVASAHRVLSKPFSAGDLLEAVGR